MAQATLVTQPPEIQAGGPIRARGSVHPLTGPGSCLLSAFQKPEGRQRASAGPDFGQLRMVTVAVPVVGAGACRRGL